MSYIGRYPDTTLKSLTIGNSKAVDSISSKLSGSSTTALATDAAIFDYVNTFEITDFNASLSDTNIVKCKTETLSTKPNAITKRNATTCIISNEDFQCRFHNEIFILNNELSVYIDTLMYETIELVIESNDSHKIEVSFGQAITRQMQAFHNKFLAITHSSGTCFVGRFIYKTETTGKFINVKYFNLVDNLETFSIVQVVKLHNILFSPKEQSVKVLCGNITRSNNTPTQSNNGDIWYSVYLDQWYYMEEDQWKEYDGFLIGQVIQDGSGIVACSTADTPHLLVNYNNSLLQHNAYNVMNYHGNSHITVDKSIVEAPLNERLTWPRYQSFEGDVAYCYIDSNSHTYLEETKPVFRDNTEYLCHPIHYWRCIGYTNFVNNKFTEVKTFDKSDYQTPLETVYYENQVLREVNGNIGTNRVDKTGRIDVKQSGFYRIDLVGGAGGGTGHTHRKRVDHTWVTHSYSNNSFACQGSSASYISVRVYLQRYDYITYTVGFGGKYRNADAGDGAIHGSNSYCTVFTHTGTNVSLTAPHGYTSNGSCYTHIVATQADNPSSSGVAQNQGTVLQQVRGAQGRFVYHEDNWSINLEGNVSPVNGECYCWGAGGKSVNTGHHGHAIDDGSHGMGGWFKLTFLGTSI